MDDNRKPAEPDGARDVLVTARGAALTKPDGKALARRPKPDQVHDLLADGDGAVLVDADGLALGQPREDDE